MGLRFNPPPGWPPLPEGFTPPPGWRPDPAWPPVPAGWPLWVRDDASDAQVPPAAAATGWDRAGQYGGSAAYGAPAGYGPPGGYGPPAGHGGQASGPAAGYGYGSPYAGPPAAGVRTNGFAITSFVLSMLAVVPLSIIFGIIALVQIPGRRQRGKGFAIAGLAVSGGWVLIVILLAVIGVNSQARRSPANGQVVKKGNQGVFALRVGDCFKDPGSGEQTVGFDSVTAIPCTQPHDAQIFASFGAAETDYPGATALTQEADTGCHARIGRALDPSKLTNTMEVHFLYPKEQAWLDGHRTIQCAIVDSSPDLTSSLLRTSPGA